MKAVPALRLAKLRVSFAIEDKTVIGKKFHLKKYKSHFLFVFTYSRQFTERGKSRT